ncbi:oligoribonuclease [Georgenia sp. EYE_87]|uniref:oligoribonuclease n=1 Tax=Georgenia sp. EYE_87 TaxID=2853448 RepID=UPI0020047C65|nr:oligoribonuclease [Georgenia sp. EYE_87]MCK6210576.1 oligoribonuclease [Georgenia sp. EYE_87]
MSRNTAPTDPIVWIDCEMTGLDLEKDALIEVAVVVTDSELVPVDAGIDLVIAPTPGSVEQMNDVVRTMHTTSGLLEELAAGLTMADAQEKVLEYVRRWVPEPRRAPLAGNSVGTDRSFLARDMPELVDHLHYRIIDVSSIKELARRWYPRAYFQSPAKNGGHRALADILESIDELRYYRAVLFPEDEGPDSPTARAAAAAVAAAPTSAVVEALAQEAALEEKATEDAAHGAAAAGLGRSADAPA